MDLRTQLEAKGYDVNTKDLAIHWICTLEWHNRVKSFAGATEATAVQVAARYVAELEQNYLRQQAQMRCEGCGD